METPREAIEARPVSWGPVWVGALTALSVALIIGLVGYAIGAHEITTRSVNWRAVRLVSLIFSIGGAFFAFVAGGWVAATLAGYRRAEPCMVHGAVAFLVAVPLLLGLSGFGALTAFGGWYGGLAGVPAWSSAALPANPEAAEAFRNSSVAAVVALLLGLVGSVLGGWMASGEPMTLSYYRRRDLERRERPRRVA